MKTKMLLGEILVTVPALDALGRKKLSPKLAYQVGKNILNIQDDYVLFEQERQKVFADSADDENLTDEELKEKTNERMAVLNELLATEVEVKIYKLSLDELEKEGVKLTPEETIHLAFMLEGDLDDDDEGAAE